MNYLIESIKYVTGDQFFWIAMSLTTCSGIYIGAILYDGILDEVKKAAVVITSYTALLLSVNLPRILSVLANTAIHDTYQPFAGTVTIMFVTLFYVLGMILGVRIVCFAHRCPKSKYQLKK